VPVQSARFGSVLALDGDTLAVSSPGGAEAVFVFVRKGGIWSQEAVLLGDDDHYFPDGFGAALALSDNTLAVGAPTTSLGQGSAGLVVIYERSDTGWERRTVLTPTLIGDGAFGTSVALADGTLVAGASGPSATAPFGSTYVFTRTGTEWSQDAELVPPPQTSRAHFGTSVALSGDTLAVGTPEDGGALYLYERSGTTWVPQATLFASNAQVDSGFGAAISLWGDALAVGAEGDASDATGVDGDESRNVTFGSGAVYFFERSAGTWSKRAYLKASQRGALHFGASVALSAETLVIGAPQDPSRAIGINGDVADLGAPGSGAVYAF
jgi:hypothetical protein